MFAISGALRISSHMAIPLSDPERELALSYAPVPARAQLRALWMLDERFGAVVAGTTDATIGEMRLLWWREALERLGDKVPDEPLLVAMAETVKATGVIGAEIGVMAEGWHALLQEPMQRSDLERYAEERGGRLFSLSAQILQDAEHSVVDCGRGWALADLSFRVTDQHTADETRKMAADILAADGTESWPRNLRPLGALTVLARRDMQAERTIRRQGSPSRVARMAWHRLTGR